MQERHKSLNLNLRSLNASATVAINEHSNRLLAEGRTVYKLGLGQSPFPVPQTVVKALPVSYTHLTLPTIYSV